MPITDRYKEFKVASRDSDSLLASSGLVLANFYDCDFLNTRIECVFNKDFLAGDENLRDQFGRYHFNPGSNRREFDRNDALVYWRLNSLGNVTISLNTELDLEHPNVQQAVGYVFARVSCIPKIRRLSVVKHASSYKLRSL